MNVIKIYTYLRGPDNSYNTMTMYSRNITGSFYEVILQNYFIHYENFGA